MKKQAKTRVPQAQSWKPKTTQSRAANKKKKVINAQVQAQAKQTNAIPHYIPRSYYKSINWPSSNWWSSNIGNSPPLTMQDIINFWQSVQNMSQPPMAYSHDMIDDTEFLLAFLTHKLGGNIVIDLEELEKYRYEVLQNAGLGNNSLGAMIHSTFQHGTLLDYRQKYLQTRSGSHKSKVNINDLVKEDHTEEILQLKALLADGTELRIPRKNFMKAIQEDIQLEVLTEHDEDFVVIRRK